MNRSNGARNGEDRGTVETDTATIEVEGTECVEDRGEGGENDLNGTTRVETERREKSDCVVTVQLH